MKVMNLTKYDTTQLRKFVGVVSKLELEPKHKRNLTIDFKPARKHVTGWYYPTIHHIDVLLPPDVPRWKVAVVIAHEMAHAAGKDGGKSNEYWMRRSARYGFTVAAREHYLWANDLPLEVAQVKPKPKPTAKEKAAAKLQVVNDHIASWEAKRKRAETALKKYNR